MTASRNGGGTDGILNWSLLPQSGSVSPVSFLAKVMEALGLRDGNLDYYLGLHAAQYGAERRAA